MKYKCIKSDPLGWIRKGKVYEIRRMNNKYYVEGEGIAVSEDNMKEMFEPIDPAELIRYTQSFTKRKQIFRRGTRPRG